MIRTTDAFHIARTGLNASQQLLNTTSNNIANVNSEGYIRERTEFTAEEFGGVSRGKTERVIDQFAQTQVRHDTTRVAEKQAFYDNASRLDDILASEANSIAAGLNDTFGAIQLAADDPTDLSARQAVIGEMQGLVARVNSLGDYFDSKEIEIASQIDNTVETINTYVEEIAFLNENIAVVSASSNVNQPTELMNRRDNTILKLAELVDIRVIEGSNQGQGVVVNLAAGESLVMADGTFSAFQLFGEPDFRAVELQMRTAEQPNKQQTVINLKETKLGGKIGGLFDYRENILEPAQREVGVLGSSIAANLNEQNKKGMDLDLQIGGQLWQLPTTEALYYPDNSNTTSRALGRLSEDKSTDFMPVDFDVVIATDPDGGDGEFTADVTLRYANGERVLDETGQPLTDTITFNPTTDDFVETIGGFEIGFPDGEDYAAGDRFLLQPMRSLAKDVELFTKRPEDLALAKPLRVVSDIDNLGDARVGSTRISNTNTANFTADPEASIFTANGSLKTANDTPGGVPGPPASLLFTDANDFQILDAEGAVIATITDAPNLKDVLSYAEDNAATTGWPDEFSNLTDFPGFDFSIEGRPRAGDTFSIVFNTDGVNDSENGRFLADLRSEPLVRQSVGTRDNAASFNEAYSNLVGRVGSDTARSDVELEAAKVMKNQSSDWFESISGVSLDEEAANMIQYQQSYAAAARVLSAASELFDTILQAAR